jgi:hypothetical protein
MKVFEDVEIEFFDMADARLRPNDEEEVVLILKDGSKSQRPCYGRRNLPTGQRLAFATYKVYSSVPCKFVDRTGYLTSTYKLEDIICWGRLKTD